MLLCFVIYIDKRVIDLPDAFNAYPLSNKQIIQNRTLLLSCCKSLGININININGDNNDDHKYNDNDHDNDNLNDG